ncbi:DUF927 domain-containing protein [Pseudovibrio sp. SCPC19]
MKTQEPDKNLVHRLLDLTTGKDVALVVAPKTGDRGFTHTICEMDDFYSPTRLIGKLRADGADPAQFSIKKLIAKLPGDAGILSNRIGWTVCKDQHAYLFYGQNVRLEDKRLLVLKSLGSEAETGIGQESGTLAEWVENIAKPVTKSKPTLFALCAAFAGTLLKFANLPETMILNFEAVTSRARAPCS